MTFINELLVGTAFPTSGTAAVWTIALHAPAARAARHRDDMPVKTAVHALQCIHLDRPKVWIVNASVAVRSHSSQASVALMFGVAPEEILRSPSPFAVPTADL